MARVVPKGLVGDAAAKEVPQLDRIMQAPQAPEDRHDVNYDNDASGWVRGQGKPYPHFDMNNAWRKAR